MSSTKESIQSANEAKFNPLKIFKIVKRVYNAIPNLFTFAANSGTAFVVVKDFRRKIIFN